MFKLLFIDGNLGKVTFWGRLKKINEGGRGGILFPLPS